MSYYRSLDPARQPVIVDAVRTPFLHSGGAFSQLRHHELAARPIRALLERSGVAPAEIEFLTVGAVVQELDTTNVAREAGLEAGLPMRVPAYSVSMAGVSPAVGLAHLCDMIALGRLDIAIAGGSENFSDIPIRLRRPVRQRAARLALAKSAGAKLKALTGLRPGDFLPELPSSKDLTTGMSMGLACEAMVRRFGVSREAADAFAVRSHQLAAAAWAQGHYAADVVPVSLGTGAVVVERDDGIRQDTTADRLARLKPAFAAGGIITAATSSGITDGASAQLLMSAAAAAARQLPVLGRLVDYQFGGVNDMHTEMLLGPAMTIPPLLARNGLAIEDIAVFELHEAFAAQILSNQQALGDAAFARAELGLEQPVGAIPLARLNTWGGSLALGNPFAGTGGRLLSTALRRLQASGERYAITATCAGGGLGAAILLENPQA